MIEYVEIPEQLSLYIESLMYETGARKDLLAFIMRQEDFNQERFNEYHKEYIEFYAKYETAKNDMVQQYLTPLYGDKAYSWNLDFNTHKVKVMF